MSLPHDGYGTDVMSYGLNTLMVQKIVEAGCSHGEDIVLKDSELRDGLRPVRFGSTHIHKHGLSVIFSDDDRT